MITMPASAFGASLHLHCAVTSCAPSRHWPSQVRGVYSSTFEPVRCPWNPGSLPGL